MTGPENRPEIERNSSMVKRTSSGTYSSLLLLSLAFLITACTSLPVAGTLPAPVTPLPSPTGSPTAIPCTLLHSPVITVAPLGTAFEGHGHITGPADAPVTIIVFSDYQCTQCALLAASLKQVRLIDAKFVRLIYLHAPQAANDKDTLAIQAVEAADLQGKFWEMHDLLFAKLAEWFSFSPAQFKDWIDQQAASLGLDSSRFRSDYEGAQVADRLNQAVQFASSVKSFTPPIMFVNSTLPYTGLADFASLDTVIRMDALTAQQFSTCPSPNVDPLKQYIATLQTAKGDAIFQLYPDKAPLAVSNFITLVKSGWYDHNTFYKVLAGQLVMSGDPSGTGYGNPGYLFEMETSTELNFDQPGMLAMDNNGPDTNGSRFFINIAPEPQMNGQYTIFGRLLNGLEVLASLAPRDPQPGVYLPPGDELIHVTVQEK